MKHDNRQGVEQCRLYIVLNVHGHHHFMSLTVSLPDQALDAYHAVLNRDADWCVRFYPFPPGSTHYLGSYWPTTLPCSQTASTCSPQPPVASQNSRMR